MAIEKKRRPVKKRTGRNGKNLNRTQKGGAARAPSAVSGHSAVRSQGAYRAANAVRSQGAASAGRGHSAGSASSRSFYNRRIKSSYKGPDIDYGPENLNSYVILNDSHIKDLNFDVIDGILSSKLKLVKLNKTETKIPNKIFFQWLEDTQDGNDHIIKKKYYKVRTVLLNSLDGLDCISNKQNLNANMMKNFKNTYTQFMMPTKTFTADDNYESLKKELGGAEWFIARPLQMKDKGKVMTAAQGFGIEYIKDEDDIDNLKILQKTSEYPQQYIITSYILNPLLYKGRKFQLRVFFLAGFINGSKIAFVAGKSRIITAQDSYDKSPANFNKKAIHDTHFSSTNENAYFPDDFTFEKITNSDKQQLDILKDEITRKQKIDSINEQMRKVFSDVAKIFFSDPKCCSQYKLDDSNQADNSYKEFGADIMITDDFQIKLIEINDRPGHNLRDKCVKPKDKGEGEGKVEGEGIPDCDEAFTRYIYEWTMDTVIIPVYNNTEIPEKKEKTVELYHPEALDRTPVYSDPPIRVLSLGLNNTSLA